MYLPVTMHCLRCVENVNTSILCVSIHWRGQRGREGGRRGRDMVGGDSEGQEERGRKGRGERRVKGRIHIMSVVCATYLSPTQTTTTH